MHAGRQLGLSLGMAPEVIIDREQEWLERATVSPSQLESFVRCPLQWYGRSILRPARGIPSEPLVVGSVVDKALELFALGHYHDDAWKMGAQLHHLWMRYPHAVQGAYDQYQRGTVMCPPVSKVVDVQVELPTTSPVFWGRRLHGFIDLLYREGDVMVVRDWKTSKRTPTLQPTSSGVSVQLGVYALGVLSSGWMDSDRIRIEYAMTRTGKVHAVEPTEAQFDQLRFWLDHTIERLAALDAPNPIRNALCNWCDYQSHCPLHVAVHNTGDDMGILDAIRPASDQDRQFLSMMVFGAPGSGKTFLAGSAAEAGIRTLVLDTESGTMTIRDTEADILTIRTTAELREAYSEIKQALEAGTFQYDLVVLDSLTEIQKLHVDELSDGGKRSLAIKQWGEIIDGTRRTVRAFRDLSCHTMVLALSKEISDDGGNGETTVRVRPAVHGSSLPHELGGFFDVVGYAGIRNGEHVVAFRGSDRVMAKDRSQTLDAIEPNDFGRIHAKVFGTWVEPEAPPTEEAAA